jgi:uncharacterized membrane protein YqaE (UPF0057 family)
MFSISNKYYYKEVIMEKEDRNLVALLLAVFLPPVGVAVKKGLGFQLVLNIILTFLGYIPGVIHALYIILKD